MRKKRRKSSRHRATAPPLSKPPDKSSPPFLEIPSKRSTRNSGQFKKGEPGPRLKHGRYSALARQAVLPEQAAFRAALAERRAVIVDELGGAGLLSTLKQDAVDTYNEQVGVLRYLGTRLANEGPLSPKGRQRALLTAYLAVSDRVLKLATALGFDKKQKPVPSIEDYLKERQA